MNRFRTSIIALAFLVACSPEKQSVDTTTTQTPSQPLGSIIGVVTSLRTGAPLSGVTVSVPGQGGGLVTASTDASGAYALRGLPAGAPYTLHFSTTGYVPGFGYAWIPAVAGDFPIDTVVQLDVPLAQGNATVSGHVYARDGAPAAQVSVTVDLRDQGFDLVAATVTDAQGAYSLGSLPGAPTGLSVHVVTQPWDANADGFADYEALSRTVVTYPAASSLLDIDLRLAAADLLLLTSDMEGGTHATSGGVHLTFNRQLDATLTTATLYDVTTARTVAVTTAVDATGKLLTVTPAGGTALAAYHTYTVTAYATAANGASLVAARSFLADPPAVLLPAVAGLTVTPAVADFDTSTFTLSWSASANASGYEVWVRDTSRNPSYLLVRTVGSSLVPSATVTLPSTFDWFSADALQTPLAYGVAVEFAVVAVNAAGDAPLPSSATPVRRADASAPGVQVVQSGSADNTAGGVPKTVTLTATFDEYMDTSVTPTITLPAGLTSTFAWNANAVTGTFTVTIPASTDGRGAYTITGAKDTSGNLMASRAGTLVSVSQLVVNGGFETGDLTGWTTSYSGTSTVPVATSAVFASGAWGVQLGNVSATLEYGNSTLSQTLTLPVGYTSLVASASYQPYTNYSYTGHDTSSCVILNSAGTATLATVFSTYANATTFTSGSVNITTLGGQTVRIACTTYQDGSHMSGMYLDNVSILATP